MDNLLTIAGVVVLVAIVLGLLLRPINPTNGFVDKDADGEPDELDGPAKDL